MKLLKLGGVLAVLGALYGGWLMLRDAPLFAVQKVAVTGLGGSVEPSIRTRLEQAGKGMTTTHVDVGALNEAVAPYTVIKSLDVHTEFPHGLSIKVIEQLPVAALVVGETRDGIAADGTVVHGLGSLAQTLPTVPGDAVSSTNEITDPASLEALEILDIAPTPMRKVIARVGLSSDGGLTVYLRNGPELYFGDTTRLHAKWAAADRVLGDQQSRGASYIDVRLPNRPAAGIDDPATSPASTDGQSETAGAPLVASDASVEPSTSTGD
ncbi:MAG TPA: cell division protein FtsQ/DivIB [Solirubrobacteraceae bacterium]|jgi:cell division protein FtsQ|nr:cell division protein FtsQ/DivIB [Solirubrobacteraceae bacterium]